ncbi:hypothetical protein JMJ58_00720 [Haloterrigena salifodinae]|uniref:Uncharacterized protein n=1 Tax=Haloterrigena salifodinae TaxID=2675099 RepID=A0A8T8E118_9EURY|nr:hypothetical protein [Haloterrigena salifodinae]QRV15458.1 hypothetical protein JMJ58_00720 [Haloterrigena salifodinae]
MTTPIQSSKVVKNYKEEISTEEERDALEEAIEKTIEYENCDASIIQQHFETLSTHHEIVDRNYEELTESIDTDEDLYWDEAGEKLYDFIQRLSNYVGSTVNRGNYTTGVLLSRLDEMCDSDPLISEVYDEKVAELDVSLHGPFFSGLRNYLVHENIPSVILYSNTEIDGHTMALDKEEILESDHWSPRAKGYADTWEDSIILNEAFEDYQQSLDRLYDWLIKYAAERFEEKHERQLEKESHAKEAQEKFFEVADIETRTIKWLSSHEDVE